MTYLLIYLLRYNYLRQNHPSPDPWRSSGCARGHSYMIRSPLLILIVISAYNSGRSVPTASCPYSSLRFTNPSSFSSIMVVRKCKFEFVAICKQCKMSFCSVGTWMKRTFRKLWRSAKCCFPSMIFFSDFLTLV